MGSIRTRRTSMSRRSWHSSSPSPERDKKQEAAACRLLFLRDHIRVGYSFFLAFFLAIDHPPPMRHAPKRRRLGLPRRLDGIHAVAHIGSPPHLVLLLTRTTNFSGGHHPRPRRQGKAPAPAEPYSSHHARRRDRRPHRCRCCRTARMGAAARPGRYSRPLGGRPYPVSVPP